MKVLSEAGVLERSERFFSTPSAMARHLFFYVTRCGHYYCDARYDFNENSEVSRLESHRNFFMEYVRKGRMFFEADGDKFTAEAGQIALIDCRRPHRFYAKGDAEVLWIHFDGANARDFFDQIVAFHGGKHALCPSPGSGVERLLAEIITGLRGGEPLYEVDYSRKIYDILCGLLFSGSSGEHKADKGPITDALRFISDHLHENLSVERISEEVSLSPAHFSRQFRGATGFSPHEYIVLRRIDEAKGLLHGSRLSVKEIAYQVGYHSEVNFINSFTEKVGVTPTSFRKNPM